MIRISPLFLCLFLTASCLLWGSVCGQMLGEFEGQHRLQTRQNNNNNNNGNRNRFRNGNGDNNNNNGNGNGNGNNNKNNGPDTSAFNIVNGRIFTPGLGILLAPQPFTPMGGDFLHIAMDVGGDGKLPVPPRDVSDPITQVFNFTIFLTSDSLQKNFTISNMTTTTPPLANIMNQEPGGTVKHINFEWPDCLVGDGKEDIGTTARGDYNITIHQNFRLDGSDHYSIFNLPISITNSVSQFPGANQLNTKPAPGPLNANGGRMNCDMISNPMMTFQQLVASVNNPPGQPYQDIQIQTSQRNQGGQIGDPGTANPNPNSQQPGNGNGNGNGNGQQAGGIGQRPGNGGVPQGELGSLGVKSTSARYLHIAFTGAIAAWGTSAWW